ncbi:hypothetical protein Aph01nite_73980 [Acrocarpospora phusangensis]|uniref:Uncharacterized protein n=1 Tax=Acrocarpospora phusangensis TaxID=1070424 RepID=A0A919USW2_9ACTN|nr:hypothetical protein [Acrocarpospora phusangensis]GIH29088.1 hypothetical protein Aph01nite_73980 [Acrocarpospora phusangensis]
MSTPAVPPAVAAAVQAAVTAERAAIVAGIRHYFAPAEDALWDDVRILCDRITRGEYSPRP